MSLAGMRLGWLAVAGFAVTAACRQEALTAALIIIIGGAVAVRASAAMGGTRLAWVVGLGYAVQMMVTVLLDLASRFGWPVWGDLQLGGGLWRFATDAAAYHADVQRILAALGGGHPLPTDVSAGGFLTVLSAVYAGWGPFPLLLCLLNGYWRAAAACWAFALGRTWGGESAGLRAAALVAWWPSLFIWTSQLLRDAACLAALLAAWLLLAQLWQDTSRVDRRRLAWLGAAGLALTLSRWYLAALLLVIVALAAAWEAARGLGRKTHGAAVSVLLLVFCVGRLWYPALQAAQSWRIAAPEAPSLRWVLSETFHPVGGLTPAGLAASREMLLRSTTSPVDPSARVDTFSSLMLHAPRAFIVGLFAPWPWEWGRRGGQTGAAKQLAVLDMVVIWAMVPALLRAAAVWRYPSALPAAAVAFSWLGLAGIALSVPSLGTLFRLRPHVLVPWLVLGCAGRLRRAAVAGARMGSTPSVDRSDLPAAPKPADGCSPRLLELLACPGCQGVLRGAGSGRLACDTCGRGYPVIAGIPRFISSGAETAPTTQATQRVYDFTWRRFGEAEVVEGWEKDSYAYLRLVPARLLSGAGKVGLEVGCGGGADLRRIAEGHAEVVGIDLSLGVETAAQLTAGRAKVHLVQADVQHIPFRSATFDFIYSLGVLHHLPDPAAAFRTLAHLLKPGGVLVTYLYEDFQDRTAVERMLLRCVGALRRLVAPVPPRALLAICWLAVPFVWLGCSVPARLLSPWAPQLASRIPFRHTLRWPVLASDLFDRFAPPIEWRFSRDAVAGLYAQAGLERVEIQQYRGWVSWAYRPAERPLAHAKSGYGDEAATDIVD